MILMSAISCFGVKSNMEFMSVNFLESHEMNYASLKHECLNKFIFLACFLSVSLEICLCLCLSVCLSYSIHTCTLSLPLPPSLSLSLSLSHSDSLCQCLSAKFTVFSGL